MLHGAGCVVEPVRIPALERENALDVFWKLHRMEVKPSFAEVTVGHEDEMFTISKAILGELDTPLVDFIRAEQAAERLRDGFAEYFQRYDALLCPVLPIPAHAHGLSEFVNNGQTVPATHSLSATVPLNVTGFPGYRSSSAQAGTDCRSVCTGLRVVCRVDNSASRFAAGERKPCSRPSPEHLA